MDHVIYYAINNLSSQNPVLDFIGIFLGVYLIYAIGGLVITLTFIKKYTDTALLAIMSVLVSRGIFVELLKRAINRPRPYEVLNANLLVVDLEKGLSFPSGHAVILFAIAFSFHGTKWFWPLLIAAVLGSLARVFIGVHYPGDVLASAVIAWLVVLGAKPALRRLFNFQFLG